MKKLLIIIILFISYNSYAQYVPKAGNKLNVKPNGILVPTSSADDTPIARLEVFASGVSTIKPTALPIASASLLGAFRVGTGLSIDGSGILSTIGGSAPDTTIYRTVANSRSLAQTQTALNAKQNNITLTTTGTSGAATLIGSTLNIPNYATGGGGGSYVDLTTNQTVDGLKLWKQDVLIDGSTGSGIKQFGFKDADLNNSFDGGFSFDGGYSYLRSGTNKQMVMASYWGSEIVGNTQGATPYAISAATGTVTDHSLQVRQLTATAPIFNIKAASGTSANYLNVSTSAGTGNVFNIKSTGAVNLPLLTATTTLALDANKDIVSITNTGTGNAVRATSPTLVTPVLGAATATTPTAKNNSTSVATTAFVGKQFTATGSGTGSATSITVAHGVSGVTSANSVIVTANNAAAGGLIYATLDATNVTIVYSVAPASGTGNLAYSISIK